MLVLLGSVLLTACASQPSGNSSFSVVPHGAKNGTWHLDGLARHGSIELTAQLSGDSVRAASVDIVFDAAIPGQQTVSLLLRDPDCNGAYALSLQREQDRVWLTDYLTTRLPWDRPLQLQVEWWSDGRLSMIVNGGETKTLQLDRAIGSIAVNVAYGEVRVENLTYTKLADDHKRR